MDNTHSKILKKYLKTNTITQPTILLKHYNDVVGLELDQVDAIKEVVKGRLVIAPLKNVTGYHWVDSDLTIYHRDDPSTIVTMDNQPPSLRVKVRRQASISFFGDILSNYRITKLDVPSMLNLIPITHDYYTGDLLLKPGATNIIYDPMGEKVELPIYFKDGVMFSKHTVRKTILERRSFKVQYKNKKYELSFRDIMYQILDFDYYARVILYRYDNTKPFTVDNCIVKEDTTHNTYDSKLMVGGN